MNQEPASIDKCLKTPRAAAIDRLLVHRRGPRPLGRLNQWIFSRPLVLSPVSPQPTAY
jgi:hypothetical protein